MKVIGITGKSGSGKTTFATRLANKINAIHVDIDKIGHESTVQLEILEELCDKFGKEILDDNGKLNRKKLGNIVFEEKQKMNELTDITWGYMQKQLDDILKQNEKDIVLEWILLPQENKYWDKCDLKILITANDTIRKNKILERDNISEEYFKKRDSASIDYSKFKFDYIIENDYDEKITNDIIEEIIEKLK